MNLLYLILSEHSFNEGILLSRIQCQLDADFEHYCMSNELSSCFMDSHDKWNVSLLTENFEDNFTDFQTYIREGDIKAIIIGDLHEYFLKPEDLNFDMEWLEEIDIPILAIDYYDILNHDGEKISCKHLPTNEIDQEFLNEVPPLQYPVQILKVFPRVLDFKANKNTIYWDTSLEYYTFVKHPTQELIRNTMQLKDNTKIISIYFDIVQLNFALEEKLLGFYFTIIDTLVYYLQDIEENFELLVIGLKSPENTINKVPNVNIRHFSHLTQDLYQLMVCGSDLLILDSNTSFAHCDALITDTPTVVLGNSIKTEIINDEREVISLFKPDPIVYEFINIMLELNKDSKSSPPIFPFINYPIKVNELPEPGLQIGNPPYHLVDIFDDERTRPLIKTLICDQNYLNKYKEIGTKYLEPVCEPLRFDQIIKRILNTSS